MGVERRRRYRRTRAQRGRGRRDTGYGIREVDYDAAALLKSTGTRYDAADQAWREAQQRDAAAEALAKAIEDRGKAERQVAMLEDAAQEIEADERSAERSAQAAAIVELIHDLADQNTLIDGNRAELAQQEALLGEYESPEELDNRYGQAMKAAAGVQAIKRELELARSHADLLARAKQAQAAAAQAEKTLRHGESNVAEAVQRLAQFPAAQVIMDRLAAIDAALGAEDRLADDVKRAEGILDHAIRVEELNNDIVKAEARSAAAERAHADAVAARRRRKICCWPPVRHDTRRTSRKVPHARYAAAIIIRIPRKNRRAFPRKSKSMR